MKFPGVPLEEACDFLSGNAWSASEFTEGPEGLPIIRIQNVDSVRDAAYVYWNRSFDSRFLVQAGDILLTLSGSFRAVIWAGPPALLNQRIVKLIPRGNVHRDWLLYVVRDKLLQISGLGRHALVSNVALSDLRKLTVPLPPLPEQRRIAAILDQADALRVKRREALAQLDSLTQSIFIEMFGDPRRQPPAWPLSALKSLGRVTTGRTPPSSKEGMFGGEVPFITPGDLDSGEPAKRTLSAAGVDEVNPVRAGAALVCCIGTVGKMAMAKARSGFNQQINAVDWSAAVDDTYGLAALRFLKDQLSSQATSTTVPILNKSAFEKFEIQVPPLSLQQTFAARVQAVEALKATHHAALVESDALFSSIQHRAFAGQL